MNLSWFGNWQLDQQRRTVFRHGRNVNASG